ncbi:unnamed protein product [Ceutorhynchus assimilis]|uniref:Thyroglobulin type-1 domain-containing protein n=1 Tax=Ceutorhynchus assimilis TaxID=467358 RepID=A0A9N9QMR4_9CUCU|nr:unnamed protein product [Ceutorhynchus assimilis]
MFAKCFVSFLVFFAIVSSVFTIGDEDIRCTAKSCKDAVCDEVPDKCKSNETNAGVYLLSPDICNCCKYCLVNLVEGEPCSVGDPSNGKHKSICGPGLMCNVEKDGETDGTCQKMNSPCASAQQIYDNKRELGYLGSMEARPSCDDDGFYSAYRCIPGQNCFCQLPNGTRIFGDANYNTITDYMTCGCSTAYHAAIEILGRELHPHEHFRCAADGSFDRLQCIHEKCLCVDSLDGAPTFPNNPLVDIKLITNETLKCYSSNNTGEYYKKCEKEYMEIHKEVENKKSKHSYSLVLGYSYPNCDMDGTFAAVQENKTHKYCVDKEGSILTEPLEKTASTAAMKSLLANMNCKCARAKLIMSTTEKPLCLKNGNYDSIQCRRGICRCVDENGNQKCSTDDKKCEEVDESQKSKLKCT